MNRVPNVFPLHRGPLIVRADNFHSVRPIDAEHLRAIFDPLNEHDPDAEEAQSWQAFWGGIICGFVTGLLAVLVPVIAVAWWGA